MSNFSSCWVRMITSSSPFHASKPKKAFSISPTMCAMATRKAFELAVKWVYAADRSIQMPYRDNLQSLIHEPTFERAIGNQKTVGFVPIHRQSRKHHRPWQDAHQSQGRDVRSETPVRVHPMDRLLVRQMVRKCASSIRNKCRASNKRSPVRKSKPKKTPRTGTRQGTERQNRTYPGTRTSA